MSSTKQTNLDFARAHECSVPENSSSNGKLSHTMFAMQHLNLTTNQHKEPLLPKNEFSNIESVTVTGRVVKQNIGINQHQQLSLNSSDAATGKFDIVHNIVWDCKSVKGRAFQNEDRHIVTSISIGGQEDNILLCGIFDGHGGTSASTFCQHNFVQIITRQPYFLDAKIRDSRKLVGAEVAIKNSSITESLVRAFMECDSEFLKADEKRYLEKQKPCPHGCAALIVIIENNSSITVANAGDCRAVLSRQRQAVALSRDHRPNVPSERDRILATGARITGSNGKYLMLPRRDIGLSLSRSIGDRIFKECDGAMVAMPDVMTYALQPHDEFIVLGCDGLWDFMSNDDVIQFVQHALDNLKTAGSRPLQKSDVTAITNKLVLEAIIRGSNDNVTICILMLRNHTMSTPV